MSAYHFKIISTRSLLYVLFVLCLSFLLSACGGSSGNNDSGGGTTPTNNSPSANAGVDQTVNEQTAVVLDASASTDADGTIASYAWSQTVGTTVTLSDSSIAGPSFTSPAVTASTTLTFQVTVTDNDGATATDTVDVVVEPVNALPTASAGSEQTVDELSNVTLNASGSSDTDGTIASYLWTQTAGTSVSLSDNSASNPTFMPPDVDAVETLSFEVTVTDNEGGTATASVNIFVNPVDENSVPDSAMEPSLHLNELYFEYAGMLGEKVWVLGYFGNTDINDDGMGYLVDNMLILASDESLPHHSFARLDGTLPPADWQGNLILAYGEIKDFVTETGLSAAQPTPLISVEKYELISEFEQNNDWSANLLLPDVAPENTEQAPKPDYVEPPVYALKPLNKFAQKLPGMRAHDCDRSVIISGGIDDSGNYSRYKDNIIAKFNKMIELGYTEEQIEVFYNTGASIELNGTNIVDHKASKEDILAHFTKLAEDMPGSCTLTIFVTDHGTGHNPLKGYRGTRLALSGDEVTNGVSYDENTFIFDARAKTYRTSDTFVTRGIEWFVTKEEDGTLTLYKFVGDKWRKAGSNSNGDGIISEAELGGVDLNNDGDTTDADFGFTVERLETRLTGRNYRSNEWDNDRDGTNDIRVRWDGFRFVVERLDEGEWKEMGRDTNGDYFIDIIDGGVDWNLDGDKADQVAFHEGINLWGTEVLWDDEFANMLKPLAEKGVHSMMEMVSCYSGGFVPNVEDWVENIYAGSSEETPHINRKDAEGNYYATDEMEFLNNLEGIDTDSWNAAADAATAADDALADAQNATRNVHEHAQTQRFETGTLFSPEGEGEIGILLDLPDDLVGQIYDFEFIYGLQNPRWDGISFPNGLPDGLQVEDAPGGIRVFSDNPIEDELYFTIEIDGSLPDEEDQVRIEFTDVNHQRLGYTMASEGDFNEFPEQIGFDSDWKSCVNHTDHGQSSPSILEWLMVTSLLENDDFRDIEVTLKITTPSGTSTQVINLLETGQLYLLLNIFTYGDYEIEILSARIVPTEAALDIIGALVFPFTVSASETNKGQCTP